MDYNTKYKLIFDELINENYETTIECAESLINRLSEIELNNFFKISNIKDKEIRLLVVAVIMLKDYPLYYFKSTGEVYFKAVRKEIDAQVIDDLYNEIYNKAKTIDDCKALHKLGFETEVGSCFIELYRSNNYKVELIVKAIKLGIDINLTNVKGETILTSIVAQGNIDAVRLLLNNGADIKKLNKKGETALSVAVHKNNLPIVRMLISRGAIRRNEDFLILSKLSVDNKKKLKVSNPELYTKYEIVYRLNNHHN